MADPSGGTLLGGSGVMTSEVARPARIERATTCLEGRCSIQLSYGRNPEYTGD